MASLMDSHSSRPEELRSLRSAPSDLRKHGIIYLHQPDHKQQPDDRKLTFPCEHFDVNGGLDTNFFTNLKDI